ncbi:hypothetical protein DVDV_3006 [Desulfovibrio sp. DV]|nr:hypothetical protein DVDV_3006 [Desulfovibrio sp. DV]
MVPSVIASITGTSVERIHNNDYEPHAVERARMASIMPTLHQPEAELARKVVGIDVALLS